MDGFTRKFKPLHRPIDDDTKSDSGIVDEEGSCKFIIIYYYFILNIIAIIIFL